jgi:hypothetical protein
MTLHLVGYASTFTLDVNDFIQTLQTNDMVVHYCDC